eukprot:scaffold13344_cov215-Alexandrium_tamarense.AAC.12
MNPFTTITNHFSPDDFVVVKLDIDTSAVENLLARQLRDDPKLLGLVDQFYFEDHVKQKELKKSWGESAEGSVAESLELMASMREKGEDAIVELLILERDWFDAEQICLPCDSLSVISLHVPVMPKGRLVRFDDLSFESVSLMTCRLNRFRRSQDQGVISLEFDQKLFDTNTTTISLTSCQQTIQ